MAPIDLTIIKQNNNEPPLVGKKDNGSKEFRLKP